MHCCPPNSGHWSSCPHFTYACQSSTHQCRQSFLSPAIHMNCVHGLIFCVKFAWCILQLMHPAIELSSTLLTPPPKQTDSLPVALACTTCIGKAFVTTHARRSIRLACTYCLGSATLPPERHVDQSALSSHRRLRVRCLGVKLGAAVVSIHL